MFSFTYTFISDENITGAVLDMITEETLTKMGIK